MPENTARQFEKKHTLSFHCHIFVNVNFFFWPVVCTGKYEFQNLCHYHSNQFISMNSFASVVKMVECDSRESELHRIWVSLIA